MKKTAVVGIGNILLKDDGVGIHILKHIEEAAWSRDITLVDGGTCIFDLLDVFVKHEKVVIIDSIKGGHAPGTIYRLTPEELGSFVKATTSLHDVQVLDLLQNVNYMGYFPKVMIIGIEPEEICFDLSLSKTIKGQLPRMIEVLKTEILEEKSEKSA
ncbi:hydrogenase maturation protease [Geosporobacter subterraneus DSM 17957]|uniref:Hydrogenase maturation protease n=1 Tax=Geosporobacter subterraneus DSM 17957 TaxID=1121919 RepID=A0A1M6D011_9FIRM|nr:hydrogenase maturation protease [Geosporobacter subterraneus]SHI66414.1 hydrogenase maturation protease [Geosporobacter subterraneus DSM 17957]